VDANKAIVASVHRALALKKTRTNAYPLSHRLLIRLFWLMNSDLVRHLSTALWDLFNYPHTPPNCSRISHQTLFLAHCPLLWSPQLSTFLLMALVRPFCPLSATQLFHSCLFLLTTSPLSAFPMTVSIFSRRNYTSYVVHSYHQVVCPYLLVLEGFCCLSLRYLNRGTATW
jgi:hypothetical protein